MRVIQAAGFYFPDSIGGTEVYVNGLAKELRAHAVDSVIAAPRASDSGAASSYTHDGTKVFRYPFPKSSLRAETQGRVPHRHFDVFKSWLAEQRADIYHQHSWTTGCGSWHLKAAKELGLKTFVTLHVPASICMRGTMLYEGREACDGKIIPTRCATCWLQSKGLPQALARSFAALPEALSPAKRLPHIGPALAARALAAERGETLRNMAATADRVVAVCGWLHDALLANGVPPGKVLLNRQGIANAAAGSQARTSGKSSGPFRLGFVGRWDPVKGVHVLVEACKRLPNVVSLELHVLATAAAAENEEYRDDVIRAAAGDPRIRFVPTGTSTNEFLATVDALVVPSLWLETGPLVVLEAFSQGVPVIGSDLGGIKELVRHDHNGLLIPHGDIDAWTGAMQRVAGDPALVERLCCGIGPVRTMADVAGDMAAHYANVVEETVAA